MQVWKETDSHISPGGEKKFELEFCFFSSILYCKEIIGVFFFHENSSGHQFLSKFVLA